MLAANHPREHLCGGRSALVPALGVEVIHQRGAHCEPAQQARP